LPKKKNIRKKKASAQRGSKTTKSGPKSIPGGIPVDRRTHWGRNAWGIVVALSAVASLTGLLVLKPTVGIGMPRYLDESDPFSARFDVINHSGLFSIRDVQIICGLNNVVTDRNIGFYRSAVDDRRNYRYESIAPGETVTVPCPLRTTVRLPGSIRSANVTLWVE
jgi:hypothetical protein